MNEAGFCTINHDSSLAQCRPKFDIEPQRINSVATGKNRENRICIPEDSKTGRTMIDIVRRLGGEHA